MANCSLDRIDDYSRADPNFRQSGPQQTHMAAKNEALPTDSVNRLKRISLNCPYSNIELEKKMRKYNYLYSMQKFHTFVLAKVFESVLRF